MRRWRERVPEEKYEKTLEDILARKVSPWQAVERLAQ
jgi:hypothetical protein